jgi:hypothetical protein
VLGGAMQMPTVYRAPSFPAPDAYYPVPLANHLAGKDLDPESFEGAIVYNVAVGQPGCLAGVRWYLGLDGKPGRGEIDLVRVTLHEAGHSLGFAALVDLQTGELWGGAGDAPIDAFSRQLFDATVGKRWSALTAAERAASATRKGQLLWDGPLATAAGAELLTSGLGPGGRVRMNAPARLEPGSSVSHFDPVAAPDLLMEPSYAPSAAATLDLTVPLLADLGWGAPPGRCGDGRVDPGEACDGGPCCTPGCTLAAPTQVCRAAAGPCDAPERCDGARPACPTDAPAPDGAGCSDGDACTTDDRCTAGRCVPGAPRACDDGNACTRDLCASATGCQHPPADGLACDDGLACTAGDRCAGGACAPGPLACAPPDECLEASGCAPGGCLFRAKEDGAACAAGICRAGVCTPGAPPPPPPAEGETDAGAPSPHEDPRDAGAAPLTPAAAARGQAAPLSSAPDEPPPLAARGGSRQGCACDVAGRPAEPGGGAALGLLGAAAVLRARRRRPG